MTVPANEPTKNPLNVQLGKRLRRIRQITGKNQKDFAETIGSSLRSYRGYESGEREISYSVARSIVEICNVDAEWFMFGNSRTTK